LKLDGIEETRERKHLPSAHEIALFRIAQESLTNVARHAHAQHVSLSLVQHAHTIVVCIADDGDGYDTEQTQAGLGIFGMRERAALLGGKLTTISSIGKGTTIEAVLPLSYEKIEEHVYVN